MKKRLELKTILIVILLIIGLALLILGNKHTYCLGFGAIFLGVASFLYAYENVKKLDLRYRELSDEYFSYKGKDVLYITECKEQLKTLKKQSFRTKIIFYAFSLIIIVFGFVSLF